MIASERRRREPLPYEIRTSRVFMFTAIAGWFVLLCALPSGCSTATSEPGPGDKTNTDRTPIVVSGRDEDVKFGGGEDALRHACQTLWSQQDSDGGWHSETYGLLKSGQAYTPFVLHTLLDVPPEICPQPEDDIRHAIDFIRRRVDEEGVLGRAESYLVEYPIYATAYALRCLLRAGEKRDERLIAQMRDYLISQQFQPENGFNEDSPAFGGWGFGREIDAEAPGHMDLAHTRRVLEALRAAGNVDAKVFERAQRFLLFVQRHPSDTRPQPPAETTASSIKLAVPYDGGFYFSPIVLAANKGRTAISPQNSHAFFRSYATATCDGIMALLAAGVAEDDERVIAARSWIDRNPHLDYVDGIPRDHPEPWSDALSLYHLALRSEVYAALGGPDDWQREIARRLAKMQRQDGRFKNGKSHLMKEDDPILATTLAIIALTRTVRRTEDRTQESASGNTSRIDHARWLSASR